MAEDNSWIKYIVVGIIVLVAIVLVLGLLGIIDLSQIGSRFSAIGGGGGVIGAPTGGGGGGRPVSGGGGGPGTGGGGIGAPSDSTMAAILGAVVAVLIGFFLMRLIRSGRWPSWGKKGEEAHKIRIRKQGEEALEVEPPEGATKVEPYYEVSEVPPDLKQWYEKLQKTKGAYVGIYTWLSKDWEKNRYVATRFYTNALIGTMGERLSKKGIGLVVFDWGNLSFKKSEKGEEKLGVTSGFIYVPKGKTSITPSDGEKASYPPGLSYEFSGQFIRFGENPKMFIIPSVVLSRKLLGKVSAAEEAEEGVEE